MKPTLYLLPVFLISCSPPTTYEDCILENMQGVTNTAAAVSITRACRTKFPELIDLDNYKPDNQNTEVTPKP